MSAERRFTAALRAVIAALNEIPAPSMIIGGIALISALHWDQIDLPRVRGLVGEISQALDDVKRLDQFDAIVERVRRTL